MKWKRLLIFVLTGLFAWSGFVYNIQAKILHLQVHTGKIGQMGWRDLAVLSSAESMTLVPNMSWQSVVSLADENVFISMILIQSFLVVAFLSVICYMISKQRQNRMELERIAYIDPITKRNNFHKLKQDSKNMLFQEYKQIYALISLDVDRFKALNDVYGYDRGNQVLKSMGDCIASHLDEQEMFGRMVSDHFTILMKYETQQLLCKRLDQMIDDIYHEVDLPYLQVSVGIYVITDPTLDFSLMNDRANMAKKVSKRNTNQSYVCYRDEMRDMFIYETELESDMYRALNHKEFEVYLQPKYTLSDRRICGAEALVRWNHSQKGFLNPASFIPLFEQNGFVVKLDYYVLDQVCSLIAQWIKQGLEPLPISVNLSRLHMNNDHLAEDLIAILNRHQIPSHWIELELTETTLDLNFKNLIPTFLKLKEHGFMVAIDDFGSGYSSLKLLKDIPADILKLDRDFFHSQKSSDREKIVIKNVIHMAEALDIRVISEGVETDEQVAFLEHVGCEVAQGFFFARPMMIQEFERIAF